MKFMTQMGARAARGVQEPFAKSAGRLGDMVSRAAEVAKAHPLGALAHDVAMMHPAGQEAVNALKGHVERGVARVEGSAPYRAASAAHGLAQDILADPTVQQHVVTPARAAAAPIAQAVQEKVAPITQAMQEKVVAPVRQAVESHPQVQRAQEVMKQVNEGAEKARAAIPHVQQAAQFAQTAAEHGVAHAAAQQAVNQVAQQVAQRTGGFLPQVKEFLNSIAQRFNVKDPGTLQNLYESMRGRLQSATAWGANAMQNLAQRFQPMQQPGQPAVKTSAYYSGHTPLRLGRAALDGVTQRL